jgi:hypothetical protein
MATKARVGKVYVYNPNCLDLFRPANLGLVRGERVRVINLGHGAPPANTMGQCYVERVSDGEFMGMVSVRSLAEDCAVCGRAATVATDGVALCDSCHTCETSR